MPIVLDSTTYGTLRTLSIFIQPDEDGNIPDTSIILTISEDATEENPEADAGRMAPAGDIILQGWTLSMVRELFGEAHQTPEAVHYKLDLDTQFKKGVWVFLEYEGNGADHEVKAGNDQDPDTGESDPPPVPVLIRASYVEHLTAWDRLGR